MGALINATRHSFLFFFTFLLLSVNFAYSAPKHAITLYEEQPRYGENFQHFDYVNPNAPKGGNLRQASIGNFDSLNPFISKGVAAEELNLIYDTLTRKSLDEPFTEYGLIAEKIERAPDNRWVRFFIRRNARFHDGKNITASDVAFTFETLIKQGAPQYKAYYADVEKVSIESTHTVRFDFRQNGNRELALIIGQLPILPKHYWENREFNRTTLEVPLGSGPYRIVDVQAGRSIRFERVKNWWAKDLPLNKGQYNFDSITIDYYRDSTVALEAFKAGQFDFWLETSAKNWATAYDSPALKNNSFIKEEIINNNPTGMQGFVFNLRRPLFQDIRVREALSLLFDFEWSNRQLFYGAYNRTRSYFENSELAATGKPSEAELKLLNAWRAQLPNQLFESEYNPEKTDGSGIIREQRRRAFSLLKESGWRIENDQMVDSIGKPITIEFLLAQPEFERILLPYKRNLASLGIELKIRRVDFSQYINRLRSRDFDMLVGSFNQSSSPGNEQREYWHSSSADTLGSRNLMGLKNAAIDGLVENLIRSTNRQQLIINARALDRALQWGFYVVPNWHIKHWRVARWNHLERPKNPPLYDVGLYTWWVRPVTW